VAAFRLAATAEADIVALLAWSEGRFGEITRRRYEMLLITSLRDVAADPERRGSIARPELGPAVRSYHLRHSLERARAVGGFVRGPRHLLLYRALVPDLIGIGRVLHDAMEIERHLPPDYGEDLK
jgi:toxin ParE1/3/4